MHLFKLGFVLVLSLISAGIWAQTHDHQGFCGMSRADLDAITPQLQANIADFKDNPQLLRSGAITRVPLKLHLVRRTDGTGGPELADILGMLCRLNESFLDQDIQFFIKGGINEIKNTTLFDNPQSSIGIQTMVAQKSKGFLNIFMTNQTGEANTLAYYSLGFPLYSHDFIVIRRSEINYSSWTLPHEVGHYFTLLHPFNGWECESWDSATHGNPVVLTFAPCGSLKSPFNNPLIEFADGSNSTIAGDFISDTPADYGFGLGWPNCDFNLSVKDKNGVTLNPDENLVMGYFLSCQDYYFTPQQKGVIAADLNSRQNVGTNNNRYLNTNINPITEPVGPVNVIHPALGGNSNGLSGVKLQWEAGAGATNYIVRIDRFQSWITSKTYFVTEPEVTLDFELLPNLTYYWQVYPYNIYNSCPIWGPGNYSFKATLTSGVNAIPGLNAFEVNPIPATLGQPLNILYQVTELMQPTLEIMDLSGRVIYQQNRLLLSEGSGQLTLDWTFQHAGIYLLRLTGEKGIYTQKIVVH